MIELRASEIAHIVGGDLHGEDVIVTSAPVISSSDATVGSLFCAFIGEKVDGHTFVQDALSRGAVASLVTTSVAGPHIIVDNVTNALAALAQEVRTRLSHLQVVAITGSQGKTTTKELTQAILSTRFTVVAPRGNFNNEIGVPLTLLQCDTSTDICVVEMGARHLGDISHLVSIARPNIGAVLKVANAHVGEFGSIEKIASAKSELIAGLEENAIAIVGMYDSFTAQMRELHKGRTFTFGEVSSADIRAADIEVREGRAHFDLVTPTGRNTVELRVVGLHNIGNALASAAIAHALGMSCDEIAAGLSMAESHAKWRMEIHELPDLLIINDAYNASPDSMAAALQSLRYFAQERGGESWAFVGPMRELGDGSLAEHARIGVLAQELGIDHLVAISEPAYGASLHSNSSLTIHYCQSQDEALTLADHISPGDVILCKASRSEKLEVLAESLEKMWIGKVENE